MQNINICTKIDWTRLTKIRGKRRSNGGRQVAKSFAKSLRDNGVF